MNLNLVKNIIDEFKEDEYMLQVITKLIDELDNLDPVWNDTIEKIINLKITNKFKKKISDFFKNLKNTNYLLILNILLESYDTIEDLSDIIQEDSFYVILKELGHIFNKSTINFQQNYTKSLKFLKQLRLTLLS